MSMAFVPGKGGNGRARKRSATSADRFNPLHQGKLFRIADGTGGKYGLHGQQGSGKQQHLSRGKAIGNMSEYSQIVKKMADHPAASRSCCQSNEHRKADVIQTFKGQHLRKLPAAHSHGLEDAEFLLAG